MRTILRSTFTVCIRVESSLRPNCKMHGASKLCSFNFESKIFWKAEHFIIWMAQLNINNNMFKNNIKWNDRNGNSFRTLQSSDINSGTLKVCIGFGQMKCWTVKYYCIFLCFFFVVPPNVPIIIAFCSLVQCPFVHVTVFIIFIRLWSVVNRFFF